MKVYSHNIVDHRTSGYVSFWWWIWTNILGIVNRDKLEGLFRWLSNLLGSTLGVSLFTYQDIIHLPRRFTLYIFRRYSSTPVLNRDWDPSSHLEPSELIITNTSLQASSKIERAHIAPFQTEFPLVFYENSREIKIIVSYKFI